MEIPGVRTLTEDEMREIKKRAEEGTKKYNRDRKKAKILEARSRRHAFIRNGMRAGFTARQVIWMRRNLANTDHKHWDGRIGPSRDDF